MSRPKFGILGAHGEPIAYEYGNLFFREKYSGGDRLIIGPSDSQVSLLDELAATFSSKQYYILYVLLVSHAGRDPGRYQSPLIGNHEDLQMFIWNFQTFFENDGRHHVWIMSADSSDMLVYDQHDVIFAYGQLDAFTMVLKSRQFEEKEFWFPAPHWHGYDPAKVGIEDEVMSYFDWKYSALQPGDEWD